MNPPTRVEDLIGEELGAVHFRINNRLNSALMMRTQFSMSTLKDDAEALCLGLIGGTTSIGDAVAWADSVILSDRSAEAPAVLDLSVSSRRPVADVLSLFSAVPGSRRSSGW